MIVGMNVSIKLEKLYLPKEFNKISFNHHYTKVTEKYNERHT